jgi:cell division protein FtsB
VSFTTFLKEKIWYIFFLLAVAYFLFLIRSDLVQNSRLLRERASTASSLDDEKVRQDALKMRMKLLNNGSYIEKLAREKLGVVGPGEKPYKVIIK